ncbi:hypothetical protein DXX98_14035 [Janibacter melonis]|nr:hypothetical protein [Janibacter melonis]
MKGALLLAGVSRKTLNAIETKAQKTQRRTTGLHQTNRDKRWTRRRDDPQYATEKNCLMVHLRLLGMMCEFRDAPTLPDLERAIVVRYIGHEPVPGSYRDALTLEVLDYPEFADEAINGSHGESGFHIGHEDPTLVPKHVPGNISWRKKRSNLIQGNMTLRESRTALIELIARYFELGEVTVTPE